MVDFVCHYQHIIGQADFRQPQKLLPVPHPAYGIVRAAQDEQLDIFTYHGLIILKAELFGQLRSSPPG